MGKVKFNIVTRFSRKKMIQRTIDSLKNQTHQNFTHFITYENKKDLDFLKSLSYGATYRTKLIKVPKYNKIENFGIYYEYHDIYTDYSEWDWKENGVKTYQGSPPERNHEKESIKYDSIIFRDDNFWCSSYETSLRLVCNHFPYNLYLKIVEGYMKKGWVIYLDDDDFILENNSLEKLALEINKHDNDTLHIFKLLRKDGVETMPTEKYFKFMKAGHPIIHKECGASCFTYHTKYKQYINWDEFRLSDVRAVKSLERVIPKKNMIDMILITTPNDYDDY